MDNHRIHSSSASSSPSSNSRNIFSDRFSLSSLQQQQQHLDVNQQQQRQQQQRDESSNESATWNSHSPLQHSHHRQFVLQQQQQQEYQTRRLPYSEDLLRDNHVTSGSSSLLSSLGLRAPSTTIAQQQQQQPQQQSNPTLDTSLSSRMSVVNTRNCDDLQQQTFIWTRILPSGHPPPPRSGAASVVVCGRLYVFGGYGGGTGRLDDFYCFHFQSQTWETVQVLSGDERPGCRENNGVVIADDANKSIFLFGGYDGNSWLNDLWKFDIETKRWTCLQQSSDGNNNNNVEDVLHNEEASRHSLQQVSSLSSKKVDGSLGSMAKWLEDPTLSSVPLRIRGRRPCRRFGYVSVVHDGRFIVWGGFDGSRWLNDMYVYTFASRTWMQIDPPPQGNTLVWPSVRSCPAWAKDDRYVYIQGGYDGVERKSDFFALDLKTYDWKEMPSWGTPPSPRYFHSCGIHGNKLYLYGGYSGSERLADLYAYDLETQHWCRIDARGGDIPSGRSSLVMQVYESHLYIFGGYDGSSVLNDFYKFRLKPIHLPPASLVRDLAQLLQNPDLADVIFLVEGKRVYANRAILAIRSQYFRVMLCGAMRESILTPSESSTDRAEDSKPAHSQNSPGTDFSVTGEEILLPNVSYDVFLRVLEFIYTDTVSGDLSLEMGIHLLIASELFMLDRLKALCEDWIRRDISVENVMEILMAAHCHNAQGLKDLALDFVLVHLNDPLVMESLSELKSEPDLLLEIIKRNTTTSHWRPMDRGQPFHNSGAAHLANPGSSMQRHDVYYIPQPPVVFAAPSFNNGNNNRHPHEDSSMAEAIGHRRHDN